MATEACGGGTPDLGYFLEVSVFIGIFGVGFTSGGSPSQPRGRGHAQGGGCALHPHGRVDAPLLCSQCQIFSNIPEKTFLNFRAFGELLFSGYFYIARIIQITDKKTIFTLFNINNRK